MSTRESVLAAVAAAVDTVAGLDVYRSRQQAITQIEGAVVVIRPESETVENLTLFGQVWRNLTVSIDLFSSGELPDQAMDSYLSAIEAAMAVDTTFGGLVTSSNETGISWDIADADQMGAGVATLSYLIQYT